MSQLILRFHDDQIDAFDWIIVDTDATATSIHWQSNNSAGLSDLLSRYPLPVALVIPQQHVYMTEFEVPGKASHQILAAIEYQIEDQLAQDTEAQHYAIGQQSENKVPIVVVEQAIMLACEALTKKFGLRVVQILPEMFLCPWPGQPGAVGLLPSQNGLILRYGQYQCIKCQPTALTSTLHLINRQTQINHINCYVVDESAMQHLSIRDYKTHLKTVKTDTLNFNSNHIINLQQRQFQVSSYWNQLLRVWKTVGLAAVILLAVVIFNRFTTLQEMEAQLQAIQANQLALIKDHVDSQVSVDSDLKKEMVKLLQHANQTKQAVGFLHLLLEFSQMHTAFPSIKIARISYQQNRLSIDINSQKLNEVEALHAALNERGLMTGLERLNIKPGSVSGQFVLRGGSNG